MRSIKKKSKTHSPRTKISPLQKQQLKDLERQISMEVSAYLVLIEEGTLEQADLARQRAKSHFLKYGDELQKLASSMGGKYGKLAEEYLSSVDEIIHTPFSLVDPAKTAAYFRATQKLQ